MRKILGSFLLLILAASSLPTLGAVEHGTQGLAAATAHDAAGGEIQAAGDRIVTFNVHSLKYHCPRCSSALACTKNCVDIKLSDAIARGGVACKRCHGVCPR